MKYKLFVMDVDGTLTDGKIYMSAQGEAYKVFDIKDGYGIKHILPQMGITPVIITGRKSDIVQRRAEELGIELIYQGISNKLCLLEKIINEQNCTLDEVVYIGDDLNDLECIKKAGLGVCPVDAQEDVKNGANYITVRNGGNGAVREVIDYLSSEQGKGML
ncbi:KdsC family phosphatase [Parablautia intestinalis]|nr:HAD-IIIA family hydrolase [Parablautia intestinalis]